MDNTVPGKGGAVHQVRATLYKLPCVLFKEELNWRLKQASNHRKCANITTHASFGCSVFYQHKITFILKGLSLLLFTCSAASVYKTDTITHTGPPSAVMAEVVQPSTITPPLLMFIQGSPVLGSLTKLHIKHFHAEYLPAITTVPIKARFHTSLLLAMHTWPFQEFRWYFFFAWDGPEWWAECLGCFLPWQHRAGNNYGV